MQKGFTLIIILLGILILGAVGGSYYFFKIKTPPGKRCTLEAQVCPDGSTVGRTGPNCEFSPCPSPKPTTTFNETANWKTYEDQENSFSFKYPSNYTLQERQKNYIVLLSNPVNPQSVEVSVDARSTGNYADYNQAIKSTKLGLTDVQIGELDNGVKISGKIGSGYGTGQSITIALLKYKQSAIEAETTTTNPRVLQVFDQILSTFKFLDK